jgi:hypothetical protein
MSRARPYLPLATALGWEPEAARRGVSKVARSARGFMRAYERAGSAKRLPEAWKRKREGFVARHVAQAEAAGEPWFEPGGSPTRRHLALIMWAYSPEPRKLAKPNPWYADRDAFWIVGDESVDLSTWGGGHFDYVYEMSPDSVDPDVDSEDDDLRYDAQENSCATYAKESGAIRAFDDSFDAWKFDRDTIRRIQGHLSNVFGRSKLKSKAKSRVYLHEWSTGKSANTTLEALLSANGPSDFAWRSLNPTQDTDYAYHATRKSNLASIRKLGLVPSVQTSEHAGEDRATEEPVVFFSPTEDHARVWGEVVLRFPWPDEYEDDPYSDTTWVDGIGVVATNMFTFEPVAPAAIEVRSGKTWKPLVARREAYRKNNPRAIPISPKLYEKASKRMVAAASRLLKNKSGDTAFESAGQIIFRNLHGKRMVVTLQAFALPASQFRGEPYEGPYLGGGFLITQDAANEAKGALFLEFRMPPKGTKPPTKQQLETLLSRPIRHELTHAVDPQTLHHYHAVLDSVGDKARGKPAKYEEDPIEVKAFQREVVDEVFRALPSVLATPAPGTILERALGASPMWAARSAGMGDRNRKRVLQAVYRAVAEEGIDPSMRIGAPARSFYREPNPRAVPLDRSRMEQIADTLVAKILKNLDDPDYADDPYPRGIVAMLPDVEMPIVPSFGGPEARRRGEKLRQGPSHVKVDIWVRATDDDRTDASLEGDTKAQHPKDYPPGYMPYGLDIILRLPGKVSKRSWKSLRRRLREEVLRVLLHEATHFARLPWIRSKKSPRAHKSQAPSDRMAITRKYLNDPEEIEARTQEIIAQAFDYLGTIPAFVRPSMQTILEFSPAWEEIDEYLSEANKRKVVQKVYRALADAGVAPTRARETTIEREFGESEDDEEDFESNPVQPDLGLSSVTENGVRFETGRPVEFRFVHGKIPAPNFGAKFQQDIEPAGRYLVHQPEGLGIFGRPVTDRVRREYEDGMVRFNRPLVLRFTDDPDSLYGPTSWKARLRRAFKAKGKALSRKLAAAGYDGIVTVWEVHGKGSHTKEIVDLTMFAAKPNPILARPPMQMHALQGGGRHFAQVIGREPGPEDYFGVHTTDDFAVAMTYARNAVDKESDPDAYPVVVSVCVDGLEELPDVDAIVKATEASQSLRAYADEDVESQAESWEPEHMPPQPGDDPYYEYVDAMLDNNNLAEAFLEAADDPQEAWDAWRQTGEVPGPVASALVRQRRWASDIDLDRVVQVDAVRPIWTKLLDDWWNSGNEQARAMAAELESKGWAVATIEHIIEGALPTERKALHRGGACGRVEYHGTSSTRLRMAFPALGLPKTAPFPTEPPDEGFDEPT